MVSPVLPLVLLLPALPVYIFFEYRSPSPWVKLTLKSACSLCFVAAALSSILGVPEGRQAGSGLFIAAFLLSMAGDALLALPFKPSFPAGLGAFFLAQCCFASAFSVRYGLAGWDAAVFAVLAGAALVTLLKAPGMAYGKMALPVAAYALALSAMAAKALSGLYLAPGAGAWAAAAGGLLFYASDVLLAFIVFNKKKPGSFRALNLIAYYSGQGLLALSLYL